MHAVVHRRTAMRMRVVVHFRRDQINRNPLPVQIIQCELKKVCVMRQMIKIDYSWRSSDISAESFGDGSMGLQHICHMCGFVCGMNQRDTCNVVLHKGHNVETSGYDQDRSKDSVFVFHRSGSM